MKNTIVLLLVLLMASCNEEKSNKLSTSAETSNSIEKEVIAEKTTFSEEELDSIYKSLVGKLPRLQIEEYMDSIQGVETTYEVPESWKLNREIAIELLDEWNEAHNRHDAGAILNHYMDGAVMNGKLYEHQEATLIKESLFQENPKLKQRILLKSVRYIEKSSTEARIDFQKVVTVNGKDKTYDSFLRIGSYTGDFMLIEEGDIK